MSTASGVVVQANFLPQHSSSIRSLLMITGLTLATLISVRAQHRIRINELQASNVTTVAEIADFNDFSDWVELYNGDSVAVDIGGCHLTDDLGTPTKWQFPAGSDRFLFSQVPNASARAMAFIGDTLFLASNEAFTTLAIQTEESRTWPSLYGITIRALAPIEESDELYVAFAWENHGEQLGRWNPRENVLDVISAQDPAQPIQALPRHGGRLFGLVFLSPDSSALVQWTTATGTRSTLTVFGLRNLRGLVVPSNFAYGITGSADQAETPGEFALERNYPNPFNPATKIGYSMKERGWVKLSVMNLLGQEVAVLVDGEKEAGYHEAVFSSQYGVGRMASGVYFYRMSVRTLDGQRYEATKRMVMIK